MRALMLGKSVELGFGGERADRYGRLQAHAFWMDGAQRRWLQGHLLEQGLARAYTLAGNHACAAELLAAERVAREARRGLWGEAAYQVRPADRPAELVRVRATFQVVEGRIARVAQLRGVIYLNFDADWRRGFSVSLQRKDRGLLGAHADKLDALDGKAVRVRGWIGQRGSAPLIELTTAGQIEVLEESDPAVSAQQPSRGRRLRPPAAKAPPAPEAETKPPGLVETGRQQ